MKQILFCRKGAFKYSISAFEDGGRRGNVGPIMRVIVTSDKVPILGYIVGPFMNLTFT